MSKGVLHGRTRNGIVCLPGSPEGRLITSKDFDTPVCTRCFCVLVDGSIISQNDFGGDLDSLERAADRANEWRATMGLGSLVEALQSLPVHNLYLRDLVLAQYDNIKAHHQEPRRAENQGVVVFTREDLYLVGKDSTYSQYWVPSMDPEQYVFWGPWRDIEQMVESIELLIFNPGVRTPRAAPLLSGDTEDTVEMAVLLNSEADEESALKVLDEALKAARLLEGRSRTDLPRIKKVQRGIIRQYLRARGAPG